MKLSYVHLYPSCFSTPLTIEISNQLQKIFPFIKIDLRSFADYFSKSSIAADFGGKLITQLPKDLVQQAEFQNSSSKVDKTLYSLMVFTFKEFTPTSSIKMRFI